MMITNQEKHISSINRCIRLSGLPAPLGLYDDDDGVGIADGDDDDDDKDEEDQNDENIEDW